jgi:DNA-binding Lrp family transcriptional regulator
MYAKNLIKSYRIIETGPSYPIFVDFSSYDPALREWEFRWDEWLTDVGTGEATEAITDPQRRVINARKIDFEIIRELELNGRLRFKEIAQKLNTSSQTIRYHYDKILAPSGALLFHFDVAPYPVDLAAHHEFMLEFSDSTSMNRFFSLSKRLFFIDQIAKRLRRNVLLARTRMISSQIGNMFGFFSEMANRGLLTSYSAVRLRMDSRMYQTISDELFDDVQGWQWDNPNNLAELNKL